MYSRTGLSLNLLNELNLKRIIERYRKKVPNHAERKYSLLLTVVFVELLEGKFVPDKTLGVERIIVKTTAFGQKKIKLRNRKFFHQLLLDFIPRQVLVSRYDPLDLHFVQVPKITEHMNDLKLSTSEGHGCKYQI